VNRHSAHEIAVTLERVLDEPLQRAVLRVENELLDRDVAHGGPDVRTTQRRRADAFVASPSASRPR